MIKTYAALGAACVALAIAMTSCSSEAQKRINAEAALAAANDAHALELVEVQASAMGDALTLERAADASRMDANGSWEMGFEFGAATCEP